MCLDTAFSEGKKAACKVYTNSENCPYEESSEEAAAWLGGFYSEKSIRSWWGDDHC